jgi:hypothetical protein
MGFGRFEIFRVYSFGRCPALIPQSLWFTTRTIHSFIHSILSMYKETSVLIFGCGRDGGVKDGHMKERQQMGLKTRRFQEKPETSWILSRLLDFFFVMIIMTPGVIDSLLNWLSI